MASRITEGDHVLLDFSDGSHVFVVARGGKNMKVQHTGFDLGALIDVEYGTVFEVDLRGALSVVPTGELLPPMEALAELLELPEADEDADNRDLVDRGDAQALTREDVLRVREESTTGGEVIAALKAGSATLAGKTAFSQEKWVRKKVQKYMPRFRCTRPTAQCIADTLTEKAAPQRGSLRSDSLGQMLTYADVKWGCRALVLDGYGGLLLGAVAERAGACATIMSCVEDARVGAGAVAWPHFAKYNLGPHLQPQAAAAAAVADNDAAPGAPSSRLRIIAVTYNELAQTVGYAKAIAEHVSSAPAVDVAESTALAAAGTKRAAEDAGAAAGQRGRGGKRARGERGQPPHMNDPHGLVTERLPWLDQQRELLAGVDSVLIATNYAPTPLLLAALRVLRPGACFAVFSQELEPLVQAHAAAAACGLACRLAIAETWTREYQVLPKRTHPRMSMHGASGYVLSGHALYHEYTAVVLPPPPAAPPAPEPQEDAPPAAV